MKKILLIDGNSIVHRAFYGNKQELKTSTNIPTNALHTFIITFLNLMPKYYDIFVAFDLSKKTFRHNSYPEYKGKRKETPNELKAQFPLVKEFLKQANVKYFEVENYEADDIIGTIAKKLKDQYLIHILSSDKDMYQLIDENVLILNPKNYEEINNKTLFETMGLRPNQIIDFKGLRGDDSDNLKGVRGIGEVKAKKLLNDYSNLENIYDHLDEIKLNDREKLINDKESAFLTRELATIYTDVNLDIQVSKYDFDKYSVEDFLTKYELKLIQSKLKLNENNIKNIEIDKTIKVISKWEANYEADVNYLSLICLDEDYHSGQIIGIGIKNNVGNYYYDLQAENNFDQQFQKFLVSNTKIKTYDLKKTIYCLNRLGYQVKYDNFVDDFMIALYILDSNVSPELWKYALNLFDVKLVNCEELILKNNKGEAKVSSDLIANCVIKQINFLVNYEKDIFKKLEENNQWNLYKKIDLTFAFTLLDLERNGVLIDRKELNNQIEKNKLIKEDLEKQLIDFAKKYDIADFNPSSAKQVSYLLYEKLKLENKYKNSTKKEALEELVDEHQVISLLLQHRSVQKLYSTYLIGLEKYLDQNNLIHSIFNQVSTNTGRLSSIFPNLQNICVKSDSQKEVRKIFTCSKDKVLIGFDYSQIELRVFAILANEQNLIKIFQEHGDVHSEAAKKIFKTNEVDTSQRRLAKIFNFGILYGLTIHGLSHDLKITYSKAKEFISKYFETFNQIIPFKDQFIKEAKENGYVQTIANRRRYINISNTSKKIEQQLARQAFNMPIQGSAADIIKVAMNDIYQKYQNEKVKMIAQIHDEIIFEVDANLNIEEIFTDIKEIMSNAFLHLIEIVQVNKKLNIEMEVNGSIGKNWFDLK